MQVLVKARALALELCDVCRVGAVAGRFAAVGVVVPLLQDVSHRCPEAGPAEELLAAVLRPECRLLRRQCGGLGFLRPLRIELEIVVACPYHLAYQLLEGRHGVASCFLPALCC